MASGITIPQAKHRISRFQRSSSSLKILCRACGQNEYDASQESNSINYFLFPLLCLLFVDVYQIIVQAIVLRFKSFSVWQTGFWTTNGRKCSNIRYQGWDEGACCCFLIRRARWSFGWWVAIGFSFKRQRGWDWWVWSIRRNWFPDWDLAFAIAFRRLSSARQIFD